MIISLCKHEFWRSHGVPGMEIYLIGTAGVTQLDHPSIGRRNRFENVIRDRERTRWYMFSRHASDFDARLLWSRALACTACVSSYSTDAPWRSDRSSVERKRHLPIFHIHLQTLEEIQSMYTGETIFSLRRQATMCMRRRDNRQIPF